jgi:hypothetical protein
MNNQEPDLNPTPAETDSAKTNESIQREGSELPVDQAVFISQKSPNCVEKVQPSRWGTPAEAPKRALGAFLPDPCPAGWRHWRRNDFVRRQIDICAAVITKGEIILLVTQFCDMPQWHLLDGTLYRHPHALEQSPAYFCR